MALLKGLLKALFAGIASIFLFIFLYLVVSGIFMLFPANTTGINKTSKKTEPTSASYISLTYGLAHTNFLIDLSQASVQWYRLLPDLVPKQEGFLLIGWGDRATYQSTPNWADLQLSVALEALLMNTPSALHIRYLPNSSNLLDPIIPLVISSNTAQQIESNLLNAFQGEAPALLSSGYDAGDRFYYSKGNYNLFNTCNTWTGDLLRYSGVEVSAWTPFSYNVVHSIQSVR